MFLKKELLQNNRVEAKVMTKCEYCGKQIHLFGKYGWIDENSVHSECYKKALSKRQKK